METKIKQEELIQSQKLKLREQVSENRNLIMKLNEA